MNKILCDELWQLLDQMSKKETRVNDIPDLIGKYIPPIAKRIGLHMINIRVDLPDSPVKGRVFLDLCPYDDGTELGTEVERRFYTRENGLVVVTGFADDEEARDEFMKLAKLTFSFCVRLITLETLDRAVITDPLTGALNTSGMHRFIADMAKDGSITDYALFFTNIKNFKYINQKIGMKKGDEILLSLVKRFKENLGDVGKIFRLGADNFVIIVPQDYVTTLIQLLKTHEVRIGPGVNLHIYFKAGIYLVDKDFRPDDIINCATAAYAVAKSGTAGDFVFYEKNMTENEIRTKGTMTAFPEAIKKREFQVYYQPKIRSADCELVGCEALVRWIRDGRVVPPMEFIPVIERLGSIAQLDLYVLERVCENMKEWIAQGMTPVRTSVNISRRDLAVSDLAERIRDITDRHSIPHELIEIELTETYSTDEFTLMSRLIKSLNEYGFKISIDDFGSGYSTLTMLKSIKADIIKLDRAFIKDLTERSVVDKVILKNVVNMVKELNIDVIAEGVESKEQVNFLSEAGCNVIQGYYYDKPLPRADFDKRLSDREYYRELGK